MKVRFLQDKQEVTLDELIFEIVREPKGELGQHFFPLVFLLQDENLPQPNV